MNAVDLYNTLHMFDSDHYSLICAHMYNGSNLAQKVSSYFTSYDNAITCYESKYTLSMSFAGPVNFNILLRTSGTLRLSFSLNKRTDVDVSEITLKAYIDAEVHKLIDFCNSTFGLDISHNYYILLINCMVYISHNIQPCNDEATRILASNQFPVVVAPEYFGKRRRKGMIKMYIKQHRKCGVVFVNNSSFQFLGFTKIVDIVETIQKVKLLT